MNGVEQLDEIIPMLEAIVRQIPGDAYDLPTACTDWTVSGVLEHMIGGATTFAAAFRGEQGAAAAEPEGDLGARWCSAMADLLAAVHTPGSQERTIAAPFGEVAGAVFARFVALDGLLHGWDLSTASRQPYTPREELVLAVDAFAREAVSPAVRESGAFAPEVSAPAGADPLARLVAFSGRDLSGA